MKKILEVLSPYLEDAIKMIVILFAVVAVLIFIGQKSLAVFYRYPLDYGEAPLVDQAMRLVQGQPLYRRDLTTPPYTVSNYPPLYPLVLTPFVALFGPAFWPGRLISTLGALATAYFIGRIVQGQTGDRSAGRVAGVLFLAIPYVGSWSSLARVDLLALALSMAGLAVLTQHGDTRKGLIEGALLLVAAVYTRQSYGLAAPLAACVWMWRRYGWRRAATLVALIGGVGLILLLGLNLATGGGFVFNIINANVNPFRMDNLLRNWRDVRDTLPILLALGATGMGLCVYWLLATRKDAPSRPTPGWVMAGPYLLGATISALTVGKVGSNVNYLLELAAALSMTAGLWIAGHALPWAEASPTARQLIRNGMMALVIVQLGFMMRGTLLGPVQALKARRQPERRLEDLLWEVRRTPDPILADEFMGMLTLNGRTLYLQPFEMTQLANAGLWDQTPLLESIRAQEFSMIMIHHFMNYLVYTERWTPEMLDAILTYYIADEWAGESVIFRPRDTAVHPSRTLTACTHAPWRLPGSADFGVWWLTQSLIFMSEGFEGTAPVYAVADGVLMRPGDWVGAVAILHDDPLRPGQKVWTYYDGMASASGERSYVAAEFPPGSERLPVKKGQLLGYQGTWHKPGLSIWPHVTFGVAEPLHADGGFPLHLLTGQAPGDPEDPHTFLDPSPYLQTAISSPIMGTPVWFPLRCLGTAR